MLEALRKRLRNADITPGNPNQADQFHYLLLATPSSKELSSQSILNRTGNHGSTA
ncbi:hypothetical protein QN374_10630 [Herbaspirillum sp. RTI4]|uniref:hypothetical protein n=1 Tax=Herbaspirillum sp. RTI4 TaxID=3048640 RepID=UPI002B226727|nr:hypothetical protein [Herbaspirillum sp. RTI4]MEA9982301.1 hypothetical protein [Herbaspirillum sp. RTI4]